MPDLSRLAMTCKIRFISVPVYLMVETIVAEAAALKTDDELMSTDLTLLVGIYTMSPSVSGNVSKFSALHLIKPQTIFVDSSVALSHHDNRLR